MTTPIKNESPQLPAYIRTYIPIIVTILAQELAKHGVGIDSNLLSLVVGGIFGAAYYAVVRYLESHKAQFGWLLGVAKQPVYAPGPAPSPGDGEVVVPVVVSDEDGLPPAGTGQPEQTDNSPRPEDPSYDEPVSQDPNVVIESDDDVNTSNDPSVIA